MNNGKLTVEISYARLRLALFLGRAIEGATAFISIFVGTLFMKVIWNFGLASILAQPFAEAGIPLELTQMQAFVLSLMVHIFLKRRFFRL